MRRGRASPSSDAAGLDRHRAGARRARRRSEPAQPGFPLDLPRRPQAGAAAGKERPRRLGRFRRSSFQTFGGRRLGRADGGAFAHRSMTMPRQRRPSRGLSHLRTLSARSEAPISAHKAYLRISFLELERARRMQEVRACGDRFDAIRSRFREIDAEIAGILASLNSAAARAPAPEAARRSPVGRRPAARHFQFAY